MKFMRTILLSLALVVASSVAASATIIWDPESSTYNGTSFSSVGFPGVGMTTTGVPAYGGSFPAGDTGTVFGFTKEVVMEAPNVAQTDLSSTVLSAGTALVLEFTKAAGDRINFVAMLADADQTVNIQMLSSTRFRIMANVVDPVASASGDAGAAFGMYIDTQAQEQFNFESALFVTDMHYIDLAPCSSALSGTAGISANGLDGVAAHFTAFMPQPLLTKLGITDVTQCQGYFDGNQVLPGVFENFGMQQGLGFDFDPNADAMDAVLKVRITNDAWSKHDIRYGVKADLDTAAPIVSVKGGLTKRTKSASLKISGSATDDRSGVSRVEYSFSSKSRASSFKRAALRAGKWSFTVSNLRKGQTKKAYVRAVDKARNTSSALTVKVTRTR